MSGATQTKKETPDEDQKITNQQIHNISMAAKAIPGMSDIWLPITNTLLGDTGSADVIGRVETFLEKGNVYKAATLTLQTWLQRFCHEATWNKFVEIVKPIHQEFAASLTNSKIKIASAPAHVKTP